MNVLKKFAALVAVIFFMASDVASAMTVNYEDPTAQVEEYVAGLPVAKKAYQSSKRPILIQGAMNVEVANLIKVLKNPVVYWDTHYLFVAGTYKNYPVVVSRTAIGVSNAAASTVLAIKQFNPIAVINQGTAGGYDPTLHVGDIVISDKTFNYAAYRIDEESNRNFYGNYVYDKTAGGFKQQKEFSSDTRLLNIAKEVAASHKEFNTTVGVIASSDTWTSNSELIKFMHENYGVLCEEMESASVAHICYTADVPFIGIRVLSNNYANGEEYSISSAYTAQSFTLYVVEKIIRDIKGGKF